MFVADFFLSLGPISIRAGQAEHHTFPDGRVHGTTNAVYGTTNADAGLGIGLLSGDSKN